MTEPGPTGNGPESSEPGPPAPGPIGAGPGDAVNDLDAYLRQYRDTFTRDAMAAKLIEAGHDPAAVEASIARIEAAHSAAVAESIEAADAQTSGARRVTIAIVLVAYALVCLWMLSGLSSSLGYVGGPGGPGDLFQPGALAFIGLAIALGALIVAIIRRTTSLAAMVAWSIVATVIGLPLVLLGACFVALRSG